MNDSFVAGLSKYMTGEEFMETFCIEEGNRIKLNINNKFIVPCPVENKISRICDNNCHDCWKASLIEEGFKFDDMDLDGLFKDIEEEDDEPQQIDISKEYDFQEMLDNLKEDSRLSFFSNNKIYFLTKEGLKETSYQDMMITPLADDCYLTSEVLEGKFYKTNIYNSSFLKSVSFEEAKYYLMDGYTVMFSIGDHLWSFFAEDDMICVSYEGNAGINEKNYSQLFLEDFLYSLDGSGEWLVANYEEDF